MRRIEFCATLAKTALRSSLKREAPERAIPSGQRKIQKTKFKNKKNLHPRTRAVAVEKTAVDGVEKLNMGVFK